VLPQTPFIELEAAGLEGVGLEHLGAGFDHRLVHSLDHIGTVEHERLVAFARQAAVVLLSQVELLERRAHAAVEHDDAPACGIYEVPFCSQGQAILPNLDTDV
jgi:hypothetical protein